MGISPTQNTLKRMRADGYLTAVVEHWNPHAHIRQDLFGIIDVLGVGETTTLAVQCTSDSHAAERVRKMTDKTLHKNGVTSNYSVLQTLIRAGWTVEVHGWKKVKNRWVCRTIDMRYET